MFSGVSPLDHMRLMREVEELKTSFGNALRVGSVHEIDAKRGYRLKLGEDADGEPWLSPWIPHPETGKTSVPLKAGQIVGLAAPNGDMRQGMLLRDGYGGDHASPNEDMQANVFADAGIRLVLRDGELSLEADKAVTLKIGANIRFTVPSFEVN